MTRLNEDTLRMVRRNKLLGMWVAEKLGLTGDSAQAYSNGLAVGALDFGNSDVLSKVRKDLDVAGVGQSDEEILRVMEESWLRAVSHRQTRRGDARDAAVVQIARNLMSK